MEYNYKDILVLKDRRFADGKESTENGNEYGGILAPVCRKWWLRGKISIRQCRRSTLCMETSPSRI